MVLLRFSQYKPTILEVFKPTIYILCEKILLVTFLPPLIKIKCNHILFNYFYYLITTICRFYKHVQIVSNFMLALSWYTIGTLQFAQRKFGIGIKN